MSMTVSPYAITVLIALANMSAFIVQDRPDQLIFGNRFHQFPHQSGYGNIADTGAGDQVITIDFDTDIWHGFSMRFIRFIARSG